MQNLSIPQLFLAILNNCIIITIYFIPFFSIICLLFLLLDGLADLEARSLPSLSHFIGFYHTLPLESTRKLFRLVRGFPTGRTGQRRIRTCINRSIGFSILIPNATKPLKRLLICKSTMNLYLRHLSPVTVP